MKAIAAASALMGLAGCTANEDVPLRAPESGCDVRNVGDLIGKSATSELGAEVQRRTGARAFRWLQPGQAVTMEYRGDRVNVHLDEQNRVTSINCG